MKTKATKKWFDIFPYGNKSPYSIELKKVREEGMVFWLQHMQTTKNWWNASVEREFIDWFKKNTPVKTTE